VRGVLAGEPGPRRDVVAINAAAALVVAEAAPDLAQGLRMAWHSIDSGAAAARLDALVRASAARAA
jgi:anthranilate phosphoribosyltransferase